MSVVLRACTLVLAAALALAAAPPSPRVVAVADVHGDYDALIVVLRDAGVIDGRRRWTGGATVLVQTGDVPDRGPRSRKVMDLLIDLEAQARRAGGRVHALLGNHEVMNMLGDLRYVSPEEYASYASLDADALREQLYRASADPARRNDPAYRDAWMDARPRGFVELVAAFAPRGRYGRWLRGHDVAVKVGDTLFVHGGISPAYAALSVDEMNARVRAALRSETPGAEPLVAAEDGPLWYRGLALAPEAALAAHVDDLLARHHVARIVVGHTVTPGVVLPRFGGKVILNDVGLSAVYGGPRSSLEIAGDVVTVRHRGTPIVLPAGSSLDAYLRRAIALEPEVSRLRAWVADGAVWPPATAPPVAP